MHHDALAVGAEDQQRLARLFSIHHRAQRLPIEGFEIRAQTHHHFLGLAFAQMTTAEPIQVRQGVIE